uniref:Uncharacterized protein n=1 Tax=Oryza meridionalis TaxID=40149 RepID=A0A0E0DMZ0_9ORYZ
MASAPRVAAIEAADGEHRRGSRRSRRWTARAAQVVRATRRTAAATGASSARATRRAVAANANPSPPLLAALSLSLSISPPRHRPGPGGRDEAPFSVFVVGRRRRLYLCQGEYKLGNRCPQEPVAPNASLGCVAWLKSGERRVPQPGDTLHRGEPARTEK